MHGWGQVRAMQQKSPAGLAASCPCASLIAGGYGPISPCVMLLRDYQPLFSSIGDLALYSMHNLQRFIFFHPSLDKAQIKSVAHYHALLPYEGKKHIYKNVLAYVST
jgi:hypothetical protein